MDKADELSEILKKDIEDAEKVYVKYCVKKSKEYGFRFADVSALLAMRQMKQWIHIYTTVKDVDGEEELLNEFTEFLHRLVDKTNE